jgi:hypothetical protein
MENRNVYYVEKNRKWPCFFTAMLNYQRVIIADYY